MHATITNYNRDRLVQQNLIPKIEFYRSINKILKYLFPLYAQIVVLCISV